MIVPIASFFVSFLSPFLALLSAVFAFQFLKAVPCFRVAWVLAFATPLAFIVCSREIPAYPSDDLKNYYGFYLEVQSLNFLEVLFYSRFEPVIFLVYKAFGGLDITIRGLLFVNALLCSVAFVSAALLFCRRLALPASIFCIALFFFPYELVSNTPRLVLAASLFLIFVQLDGAWRYCFLILALLSHKFIFALLLVYLLAVILYRRRILVSLAPLFFVAAVFLLPSVLHLPLFNRLRYYFLLTDVGGYSVKYIVFSLPFLFVFWRQSIADRVKSQAVFFYFLCMLAFSVSPYGALGDRIGQPVWMPFAFFLFFLVRFKRDNYSQVFFVVAAMALVFARLLLLSDLQGHDPFSEYEYMSLYALKLIYGYLVSPI